MLLEGGGEGLAGDDGALGGGFANLAELGARQVVGEFHVDPQFLFRRPGEVGGRDGRSGVGVSLGQEKQGRAVRRLVEGLGDGVVAGGGEA